MIAAKWASSGHETIGQEHALLHIVELFNSLLVGVLLGMKLVEDVLSDLGLPLGSSAAKVIEITIEPVIDLSVDLVIVITNLLRGLALFKGFDLGGSTILVGTANVQGVVAH